MSDNRDEKKSTKDSDNMFGVPLQLVAPRDTYQHGWGQECHNPKSIVRAWVLRVQDKNGNACKLFFDLVNGSSPNTHNLCHEPTISLQRPQDDMCYSFLVTAEVFILWVFDDDENISQ